MKFTLSWLKEYLKTTADLEEISDKLTMIGLEVEEIINPAEKLAGFVTAEILTKEKHPNADRLNLLSVFDGTNTLQIVCGAPNCYAGMKVVLAKEGTIIPLYNEALKKGVIRGIESNGMLCSERELGLGDDHTGIKELPKETPVGVPLTEVLKPDAVIEINVTPNRGDCLGVKGIARDLAAAGLGEFVETPTPEIKSSFKSPINVSIETQDCPVFTGRLIKGVKNGESPQWLKDRLTAIGLRPISALVDITNYFNIGEDRPLHVFDAGKLSGNLCIRSAKEGEKILALDGKEYDLHDGMIVIADEKGPQSVGGVMGGENTGCSSETTDVFLESAYFNPVSVAKTSKKLKLESDSKSRFERGIDPKATLSGLNRATAMILDLCGGEASEIVMDGQEPSYNQPIAFDYGKVEKLTGVKIPQEKGEDILIRLGFQKSSDGWTAPSWRSDVDGQADLVEEILRIYGYDSLPLLSVRSEGLAESIYTPEQKRQSDIRRALANQGLNQAITWSFMHSELAKDFGSKGIRLQNPITSELDEMRPSLVPNLLSAVKRNNDKGEADVRLFELGPEFFGAKPCEQRTVAACVRSGMNLPLNWREKQRKVDVFDAKEDALAALKAAGIPAESVQTWQKAPCWYHPGKSGSLMQGKNVLAVFGEIHPEILKKMDIKGATVACEVYVDALPQMKSRRKVSALDSSNLQSVQRDFAFIVSIDVQAEKLLKSLKGVDKNLIKDVILFDVYEGEHLPEGKKSLAVKVILQPTEKTLTDAQIEQISDKIVKEAQKDYQAELRS
jgi:phenylalanyl-tRNA synthetase beta chain